MGRYFLYGTAAASDHITLLLALDIHFAVQMKLRNLVFVMAPGVRHTVMITTSANLERLKATAATLYSPTSLPWISYWSGTPAIAQFQRVPSSARSTLLRAAVGVMSKPSHKNILPVQR